MASNALPSHPSKRHPLTGEPLQALWVRPDGKPCWPIMGGSEDSEPEPTPEPDPTPDPEPENGFPTNTPLEQMSVEQREAYWKHQARKHEQRAKNAPNSDELRALREKAARQDALEDELASDMEKAIKEARTTTQAEAEAKYRPMLAETAFRVAIGDRKTQNEVDDFIADLNLSRFIKDDGVVDTAKVLARVDQFAPAKGAQNQRGPQIPRGGTVGGGKTGTGLAGLPGGELYDRLHPKKHA